MQKLILEDGKLQVIADNVNVLDKDVSRITGEFTADSEVVGYILSSLTDVVSYVKFDSLNMCQESVVYTRDKYVKLLNIEKDDLFKRVEELRRELVELKAENESLKGDMERMKNRLKNVIINATDAVYTGTNGRYRMNAVKTIDGYRFNVERD